MLAILKINLSVLEMIFLPTDPVFFRNRILIFENSPKCGTYGLVFIAQAKFSFFSGKFISVKELRMVANRVLYCCN